MVPTPSPSSEKIPMRRDKTIAEAEKMGIIFMFFGEQKYDQGYRMLSGTGFSNIW